MREPTLLAADDDRETTADNDSAEDEDDSLDDVTAPAVRWPLQVPASSASRLLPELATPPPPLLLILAFDVSPLAPRRFASSAIGEAQKVSPRASHAPRARGCFCCRFAALSRERRRVRVPFATPKDRPEVRVCEGRRISEIP